jgi:hypothetical protein
VKKLLSFFRRTEHPNREALSAYLDARPGAAEAAALAAHLASCAACRSEFDALGATQRMLRSLPDAAPQRSFRLRPADVERATLPRTPSPMLRAVPMLGAAAVIVFAIAIGIDAFGRGGSSNSSENRPSAAVARDTSQSPATTRAGDLPAEGGIAAAPTVAGGAAKSTLPTATTAQELAPTAEADSASAAEVAPETGSDAAPPAGPSAPSTAGTAKAGVAEDSAGTVAPDDAAGLTPDVEQTPPPRVPATSSEPDPTAEAATDSADYNSAATQRSGVALSGEPTSVPSAPVTAASRTRDNESGGGVSALRVIAIIAGAAVLAAAGVTMVFRIRNREVDR